MLATQYTWSSQVRNSSQVQVANQEASLQQTGLTLPPLRWASYLFDNIRSWQMNMEGLSNGDIVAVRVTVGDKGHGVGLAQQSLSPPNDGIMHMSRF